MSSAIGDYENCLLAMQAVRERFNPPHNTNPRAFCKNFPHCSHDEFDKLTELTNQNKEFYLKKQEEFCKECNRADCAQFNWNYLLETGHAIRLPAEGYLE